MLHEMATNQSLCIHADDDCIEMELSSTSNFICYSNSSPPQSREFEFQMSSVSHGREATTSPADELFYKGKLLPLHLPPRLLMVQKLLQNPTTTTITLNSEKESAFEDNHVIPLTTSSTAPSTDINTPLESCNISPSESCRVSSELNPDEYFFEWPPEANCFLGDHQKKSWTKKLKQSSLGLKLKASRAYLKSLFKKSGCTDESCAKAACNAEDETVSNGQDCLNKYMKVPKKSPFGNIDNDRCRISNTLKRSFEKEMAEDGFRCQRRSFSGAIQWHSATKSSSFSSSSTSTSSSGLSSSSSSFSFSSNGFCDLQLLKRSGSSNSEFESSITEAIAHCKRSHQLFSSRKSSSEVGVCSLSASVIAACGDQETPRLRSI